MLDKFNVSWVNNHRFLDYKLDYLKDDHLLSIWKNNGIDKNQTKIYLHQMTEPYNWMGDIVNQVAFSKNLKHVSFAFHKIPPGNFLGMHSDKYGLFRKKYNITDINKIHRIIVFLEDACDGHLLISKDKAYINWKKGDSCSWIGSDKHLAANLGIIDRYTLQITGLIND